MYFSGVCTKAHIDLQATVHITNKGNNAVTNTKIMPNN